MRTLSDPAEVSTSRSRDGNALSQMYRPRQFAFRSLRFAARVRTHLHAIAKHLLVPDRNEFDQHLPANVCVPILIHRFVQSLTKRKRDAFLARVGEVSA